MCPEGACKVLLPQHPAALSDAAAMPKIDVELPVTEQIPRKARFDPLDALCGLWTGSSTAGAIASEERLLRRYVTSPWRLGRVRINLTELGLGEQYINTLVVNPDVKSGTPIVWTHGAGAGLAFGYRNFDTLANPPGRSKRRLIAFDWLGQAGSSRPTYPYSILRRLTCTLSDEDKIDEAIRFSVDSLETWRASMQLEEFDLIAHSMGGYLSTQYAMRHPTRVRRLILISPVGWADQPKGQLSAAQATGFLRFLWDAKIGNFGMTRLLGRSVRGLAKRIMVGRLGIDNEEERQLVTDYFWQALTSQPISAEQAVNHLLVPYVPPAPFGFYARRPVSTEASERLVKLPPTLLLYGSHDLHYIPTMPDAIKAVRAVSHNPVTMRIISRSDHHLYIDNPTEFHASVEEALA
jgi:pimeloyl-ACP methyl ester carboxylesterase